MPKIIIQCDCEKGQLEKIAETQQTIDFYYAQDRREHKTIFYECGSCKEIFTQRREFSENYELQKDSEFKRYSGELTKEEIVKNALLCYGNIKDETKIINKRKK